MRAACLRRSSSRGSNSWATPARRLRKRWASARHRSAIISGKVPRLRSDWRVGFSIRGKARRSIRGSGRHDLRSCLHPARRGREHRVRDRAASSSSGWRYVPASLAAGRAGLRRSRLRSAGSRASRDLGNDGRHRRILCAGRSVCRFCVRRGLCGFRACGLGSLQRDQSPPTRPHPLVVGAQHPDRQCCVPRDDRRIRLGWLRCDDSVENVRRADRMDSLEAEVGTSQY